MLLSWLHPPFLLSGLVIYLSTPLPSNNQAKETQHNTRPQRSGVDCDCVSCTSKQRPLKQTSGGKKRAIHPRHPAIEWPRCPRAFVERTFVFGFMCSLALFHCPFSFLLFLLLKSPRLT